MEDSSHKICIGIDTSALDEVTAKTERLVSYLKEAMELANSIASMDLDLRINAVFDDESTELACISTE